MYPALFELVARPYACCESKFAVGAALERTLPETGEVTMSERGGRLEYRWGAVFGPAETYDASRDQLRIEIAGSGQVVTFEFAGPGPARSLSLQGITFAR